MHKILIGKAKEDFENYVLNKELGHDSEVLISVYNQETLFIDYKDVKEILLNALIVEWFDSVGICIDRDCINMEMVITDFRDVKEKQTIIDCGLEEPFPDWWKKAIKKANEIYNEKYSISQ